MAWLVPTDDSALADTAPRNGTVRSNKTPRSPCTLTSPPLVCSPVWKHRLPAPVNVIKVNSITGFCYLRLWVIGRCWLGCSHGRLFQICSRGSIRSWRTQSFIVESRYKKDWYTNGRLLWWAGNRSRPLVALGVPCRSKAVRDKGGAWKTLTLTFNFAG
jgi:hypothetical protein